MSTSPSQDPLTAAYHHSHPGQPDEDSQPLNSSLASTTYQLPAEVAAHSLIESCDSVLEADSGNSPAGDSAGPPNETSVDQGLALDGSNAPRGLNSHSPSNFLDVSFVGAGEGITDWNASYASLLNLDHIYANQEELVNEQRELARSLEGPSQTTRALEVTSSITPHPAAVGPGIFPFQGQLPASNHSSIPGLAPPACPSTSRASKRKADSQHTPSKGRTARPKLAADNSGQSAHEAAHPLASNSDQCPTIRRKPVPSSSQQHQRSRVGSKMDRSTSRQNSRANTPNVTTEPSTSAPGVSKRPDSSETPKTCILPPEKVFPIQIGSELFRLSGASISSDAPSYFSHFFEEQLRHNEDGAAVRTLYIDRDPGNFRDILRHLQGYYVRPRDGSHLVKLFADAQFYSLPRLISQLVESEIFIQIGERHFQIPRDIFCSPGDSPNFFSLAFAIFFTTSGESIDRPNLLRPPAVTPPVVINRSAEVFAELLHMLKGYPIHIRNEEHRAQLLRDCRYFHLRGLEQKLIPHAISYNLLRQRSEIMIRLEDIRQSGVQFVSDVSPADRAASGGRVHYSRPFVDDASHELIVEIGDENTFIDLNSMRADFVGLAKARVSSLFQVIANKMNLPTIAPLGLLMKSGGFSKQPPSPGQTPLSEDQVKIRIDSDADIVLDGEPFVADWSGIRSALCPTPGDTAFVPSTPGSNTCGRNQSLNPVNVTEKDQSSSSDSNVDMPSQPPPAPAVHENSTQPLSVAGSLSSCNSPSPLLFSKPDAPRAQNSHGTAKRKRLDSIYDHGEWAVQRGQWRIRVQANAQESGSGRMEIVFVAVKLHAFSGQRARNASREFLS
ncbi:glutathione S-transferase [Blastomyces parvus]|uniref:Glutathione S-transferase n=1 Tax=Blastomyces parvus TaxID=2060905 RepID=A0A2B7X2W8_9EURO|nr:glutathione S-transferase [Blastomyces parvus]